MDEDYRLVQPIPRSVTGDVIGPGSLKVVVVGSAAADAVTLVGDALRERLGDADVRVVGWASWLVYTDADAGQIRDWIAPHAGGCAVFVAEFEAWAGHGGAIDRAWLLRRGH
jgi:hypothetical protein